jgi:trimethylamine---corrinoid protein Co-methyltransferase
MARRNGLNAGLQEPGPHYPREVNMKFTTQVLSASEQQRVHAESLRILGEVGVKYLGKTALPLLKKAGARVDEQTQIARLPNELVEQAVGCAPRSFTLGARNPAYDYPLPSPVTRYCIDGTAAFALDFHTGERRYGTLQDIENGLRIFQQLDMGVMAWAPTTASETPACSRALHEFFAMMKFSSKHGEHEVHFSNQVPYLIDGLLAVVGSEDELRRRNPYSLIYCPVAPLMHDGEMLDAYLELGRAGLPVMILPMPVPGTTGPASLFANICQANAEALSAITIFELAHPGRPMIYSNATGTVDFRNGAYLGGSPEMGLMAAALTQMGRYYGLPTGSAGCTADAKQPGPEAVIEKLITALPPVCAGADIIIGMGEIESDQLLVLEQLVIDNELAHFCERLVQGVDASPQKELFEDIAQTGPGGNYLKLKSTRLAARSDEFFYPLLFDRNTPDKWNLAGRPGLYGNARQKVHEMLATPLADPLPEAVCAELDAILSLADRELADKG